MFDDDEVGEFSAGCLHCGGELHVLRRFGWTLRTCLGCRAEDLREGRGFGTLLGRRRGGRAFRPGARGLGFGVPQGA